MKSDSSFHNHVTGHSNNNGITPNDKIHEMFLSSLAVVFYCPQAKAEKERFYCNEDALNVLTRALSQAPKNEKLSLSSLCSQWEKLLEEKIEKSSGSNAKKVRDVNTGVDFIDILKSDRRRYGVRGTILLQQRPIRQKLEKRYLFILERLCVNYANIPMIMRSWNFNRREREIVELLLAGRCNKEIAHALGLSLNTVKMYLTLLMGKLGVSSRNEIVAMLLSGKLRRTY